MRKEPMTLPGFVTLTMLASFAAWGAVELLLWVIKSIFF